MGCSSCGGSNSQKPAKQQAVVHTLRDPVCKSDVEDNPLFPNGCAKPSSQWGWGAVTPIVIPAVGSSTMIHVCDRERFSRDMCIRVVGNEGEAFFRIDAVIPNSDGTAILTVTAVGARNPDAGTSLATSKGTKIFSADCPESASDICLDVEEVGDTEGVFLGVWHQVKNSADCIISTCLRRWCPRDNSDEPISGLLHIDGCEVKVAPCDVTKPCLQRIIGYAKPTDECTDPCTPVGLANPEEDSIMVFNKAEGTWCPMSLDEFLEDKFCKEWNSVAQPDTATYSGTGPSEPGTYLIVKAENDGESAGVLMTITVDGMVLHTSYVESNALVSPAVSMSPPIPLPCGASYSIETVSGTIRDVCIFQAP